jgi:hypothetical protein
VSGATATANLKVEQQPPGWFIDAHSFVRQTARALADPVSPPRRGCQVILRRGKFGCYSAVQPFCSPDRPRNSAVRQLGNFARIQMKSIIWKVQFRLKRARAEVFPVFSRPAREFALE